MTKTFFIEAIILDKEERAENFLLFKIFSKELGLSYAIKKATTTKYSTNPDFFDLTTLELRSGKIKNNYFIKKIEHIDKLCDFSHNYKALEESAKLSQCIIRNSTHLESYDNIYNDFLKALKAYNTTKNPKIINIKWLYKFARNEGYPIKEDFAKNLSPALLDNFVNLIKNSSSNSLLNEEEIDKIYSNLSIWLNHNTDIIYK